MRVFLCPYEGFSLAVQMDAVLSVILYRKECEKTIELDPQSLNTYISLPMLFNYGAQQPRHGIILKDGDDERLENKTVLLTYEIEREIEIAQNKIYPLPKYFSSIKFSQFNFSLFFTGLVFSNHHRLQEPVLLINPEHIVQNIKKELNV